MAEVAAVGSFVDGVRVVRLTPTERRMLTMLSDGMPHDREELQKCLWDDRGDKVNIKPHLSRIRRVLRLDGEDVICEFFGRTLNYRHIILVNPEKAKRRVSLSVSGGNH